MSQQTVLHHLLRSLKELLRTVMCLMIINFQRLQTGMVGHERVLNKFSVHKTAQN